VGIQLIADPLNTDNTANGVVVDGNGITATAVGIDLHTNIVGVSITDNNLIGNATPLELPVSHSVSELRIAGNLSDALPALITPQPPLGTSATQNTYNYDCMVSVVGTGSGLTSIQVNYEPIAWPPSSVTVLGPIVVRVPVNGYILAAGSGASWYWTPLP
jgi:hypothetical protein